MANDYMAKLAADLEGRTMGGLASMGRRGDTMLAYVSPQDAEMLIDQGGSGTINPMTGLPEFFWSADTSADDEGNPGDAGDAGYDFEEAMAFAESANLIGNRQGNMDAVDAFAYQRAAIADPNLPTGERWDPSTPGSKGGIPQRLKEDAEKKEREQLELLRLVEQLKNKKPGEKVTTRSGRTLTKEDIKARDAEREAQAAVRAKDSLPRDNEGKVSYMALFDRYATPKERDMKTEIKNGVTIRTNRVDPPDTSELIDRHYKAHGLVEVKDRAGKTRLADDPGYGYSKENVYDRLKDNRDEWEDIKFLSTTLPGGAKLRDRSGDLLAPFREESISTVGFPNQTLTGYSGPSLSPLAGGGKVDGIQALADSIESYGRKGDTMLAHINPKEAQMLKDAGGSGTINPMTGLPEFYFDEADAGAYADAAANPGDADDGTYSIDQMADLVDTLGPDVQGPAGEQVGSGPVREGPMSDEQAALYEAVTGLPPGSLGSKGVGTGGPREFEQEIGWEKSTVDALKRAWKRDGIPEEYWGYWNALKDGQLTNDEAYDFLAGLAGIRGGAQGLFDGYRGGYKYGGPRGTMLDILEKQQINYIEDAARAERAKQDEQDRELDDFVGEPDIKQEPGFFDKFDLNLFGGPTARDQDIFDSLRNQGLEVTPRSTMDTFLGFVGNLITPGPLGSAHSILGKATGSNIIGQAFDPATGFSYLVDASGNLQLAPYGSSTLGEEPDTQDPGGNMPVITKKRRVVTKPVEEEEKEEEEEKDYFPKQKLPRLSQSGLETLQYTLRNDPEALENIYNKYALPEQYSGLKALV